jgi:hypothetical protein
LEIDFKSKEKELQRLKESINSLRNMQKLGAERKVSGHA